MSDKKVDWHKNVLLIKILQCSSYQADVLPKLRSHELIFFDREPRAVLVVCFSFFFFFFYHFSILSLIGIYFPISKWNFINLMLFYLPFSNWTFLSSIGFYFLISKLHNPNFILFSFIKLDFPIPIIF